MTKQQKEAAKTLVESGMDSTTVCKLLGLDEVKTVKFFKELSEKKIQSPESSDITTKGFATNERRTVVISTPAASERSDSLPLGKPPVLNHPSVSVMNPNRKVT